MRNQVLQTWRMLSTASMHAAGATAARCTGRKLAELTKAMENLSLLVFQGQRNILRLTCDAAVTGGQSRQSGFLALAVPTQVYNGREPAADSHSSALTRFASMPRVPSGEGNPAYAS